MHGLGRLQAFSQSCRAVLNWFPERLEYFGVGILRGVLPKLFEGVHQCERILTHVTQLIPEPIELRLLHVIEHQTREWFIFPVKQC